MKIQETLKELPRKFHEAYERLAPTFGYETREDTKEFDADSSNGKLMGVVVNEVMTKALEDTREEAYQEGREEAIMGFAIWAQVSIGKPADEILKAYGEFLKGEDAR